MMAMPAITMAAMTMYFSIPVKSAMGSHPIAEEDDFEAASCAKVFSCSMAHAVLTLAFCTVSKKAPLLLMHTTRPPSSWATEPPEKHVEFRLLSNVLLLNEEEFEKAPPRAAFADELASAVAL
jgi:hypothetical protein